MQITGLYMLMGPSFSDYISEFVQSQHVDRIISVLEHKANGLCAERSQKKKSAPSTPTGGSSATYSSSSGSTVAKKDGGPNMVLIVGVLVMMLGIWIKFF